MIKFSSLMQAIQYSIQSAARQVESSGIKHLARFFDEVDEHGNKTAAGDRLDSFDFSSRYQAKTVAMDFPKRTPDGVEMVPVRVPLIALSPISTPRVSEARFTVELEVLEDDETGGLMVSFPGSKKPGFLAGEVKANTKIEITIKGDESPEGLQLLIEGYERALRAQIPGS